MLKLVDSKLTILKACLSSLSEAHWLSGEAHSILSAVKHTAPSDKKLVAVKGIKGRQNLFSGEAHSVFKAHIFSLTSVLHKITRENLSELGLGEKHTVSIVILKNLS